MKFSRLIFCSVVVAFLCLVQVVHAANDPAAAVVKVRKNCTDNNVALDNCFTTLADLTNWMANTRLPNASNPLKVEIGPGTFTERLDVECNPAGNYTGYTSFEGAGNSTTILNGSGDSNSSPVMLISCTELSFSHLTINGRFYGGIQWSGGGKSHWIDVTVNGMARAWYENQCAATRGSHYWVGSKLTATALTFAGIADTYEATCDESWFYGSEITVSVPSNAYQAGGGALIAYGNGIIHVYGSVIRALIDGPTTVLSAANVGLYSTGGEVHIHGSGIDLISNTGKNVVALYGAGNGMIHANSAAYNMQTTGVKTRILKAANFTGHIHAPYLWEEHPEVPNITSVNGSDMAVVTNTLNGQPHLVLYSDACQSKWFDTATQACR